MDLLRLYADHLPDFLFNGKLYAVLALCLALEAVFFVRARSLLSVELAQDFVFGACKKWLFLPLTLANAALWTALLEVLLPSGGWAIARSWPFWAQVVLGFAVADLAVYASHVALHKVRPLRHFHALHHSQTNLNPLTTHRSHFVENLFDDSVQLVALALIGLGLPTWLGVRAFNWLWVHLTHSNVRWNLGPLGWVVVSPQHHRLHHSIEPEHWDRNFGARLAIWDRIFGTSHPDRDVYPDTGITDASYPLEASARPLALLRQAAAQYAHPFSAVARDLRRLRRGAA